MKRCKTHNQTELTPKEVGNVLNKNYRTILRWVQSGRFRNAHKCEQCGVYLIPCSDVDAYIESLKP